MKSEMDNQYPEINQKPISIDQSWKTIYKTGGMSLVVGGIVLILFLLSIFIFQVSLPLRPQNVLENPTAPVLLYLMAAIGESLLMPGALAAYLILRPVGKNRVLLGATLWVMMTTYFILMKMDF